MADDAMIPVRRVVTGNDTRGRSRVVWDGPAPNAHDAKTLTNAWTDFWVWHESPAPLEGQNDDGNLPYDFPGPPNGGHLRAVYGKGSPAASAYSSAAPHPYMQKVRALDFAIVLEGEIVLQLDTEEVPMKVGEIAIVRGSNHAWSNRSNHPAVIAIASHGGA
ncbi:MAG: cupin domain-containing protein [Betaproteobacteria bacterium]|nr:cupin domain-containing protein [Betaproteobacteria bacterium]